MPIGEKSDDSRLFLPPVFEIPGHEVALHGPGPLQRDLPLQVDRQDIQRLAVGIGVFADPLVFTHLVPERLPDIGPLVGKSLGEIKVVEQIDGEAFETLLVERVG